MKYSDKKKVNQQLQKMHEAIEFFEAYNLEIISHENSYLHYVLYDRYKKYKFFMWYFGIISIFFALIVVVATIAQEQVILNTCIEELRKTGFWSIDITRETCKTLMLGD